MRRSVVLNLLVHVLKKRMLYAKTGLLIERLKRLCIHLNITSVSSVRNINNANGLETLQNFFPCQVI